MVPYMSVPELDGSIYNVETVLLVMLVLFNMIDLL